MGLQEKTPKSPQAYAPRHPSDWDDEASFGNDAAVSSQSSLSTSIPAQPEEDLGVFSCWVDLTTASYTHNFVHNFTFWTIRIQPNINKKQWKIVSVIPWP